MWKDYDQNDQSTWTVMEAPPVDPSWVEALTRIGGLNPFGQPVLVWRWGGTYRDPMSEDYGLKYWIGQTEPTLRGFGFTDPFTEQEMMVGTEAEVPNGVLIAVPKYTEPTPLGQRRIIIENWRSPEFLARSGRYIETMRHDPDTVRQFFFCKACDLPLVVGDDGPKPCSKCESKRSYLREARFEGDGTLLRTFPSEGCYDCFLILENELGEPMDADANSLRIIEAAWHKHTTQTMREQLEELVDDVAPQEALRKAATSPANPFQAPPVPGW